PNDIRATRFCGRRANCQSVRRLVSSTSSLVQRQYFTRGRIRSSLGSHSTANCHRWRRIDDGQLGIEAQFGFQRERSLLAAEEQLRLPADRRFWTTADRSRGVVESVDRAAGKPSRLFNVGQWKENRSPV